MPGFLLSFIKQQLCLTPKRSICLQRRIEAGVFNRHFKTNNNSLSCLPFNGEHRDQLRNIFLKLKIPIGLNYRVSQPGVWQPGLNWRGWMVLPACLSAWYYLLFSSGWLTECLPIGCGNPGAGPVSPRMSLAISFSIVGCLGWATRKLESLHKTNRNYLTLLQTLLHTLLHAQPKRRSSSLTLSLSFSSSRHSK